MLAIVPKEKARRLVFDNDEDQEYFRFLYNTLALCEGRFDDIRILFVISRLFRKLDDFSVAAPLNVPPIGKRRQRMLPEYPGHELTLVLTVQEMTLLEVCLQMIPWDLENARRAAAVYEWMLKTELIEASLLSGLES